MMLCCIAYMCSSVLNLRVSEFGRKFKIEEIASWDYYRFLYWWLSEAICGALSVYSYLMAAAVRCRGARPIR